MTITDSGAMPSRQVLLDIFRKMTLIRQCDEKFQALLKAGLFRSQYYSGQGQEAIPSALAVNLNHDDYLVTTFRGIHDAIAKGIPLKPLFAEVAGKVGGTCKGKGGPMHVTHPASGIMVTTGIVGSGMPIANGLALAIQLKGEKRVAVATFGDGASNIGAFHEALNLASIWKLPAIFVCQNNRYAEHTAFEVGTAIERVADRAAAYTMPGIHVDGNDPIAMWRATREAVERARSGGGPTLIEAVTFRFCGHNFGDDDSYMPKGLKAAMRQHDPLPKFRSWLVDNKHASDGELSALQESLQREIEEAAQSAIDDRFPDMSELGKDVFAEEVSA